MAPARAAAPAALQPSAQSALFARWLRPVVRTGTDRTIVDALSTPAVVDEAFQGRHGAPAVVVVGTGEGNVLALDQEGGALRWRYRHGAAIDGPVTLLHPQDPAAAPTVALACGRDAVLVALRLRDGKVLWRTTLDAPSRAPAVLGGQQLLVTTEASQVVALAPATGRILWQQGRAPVAGLALLGHGRAAYADGRVFAGFADGFAAALDAKSGRVLWERPLSLQGGRFVDVDADPQVVGGRVLFASITDGVYALDAAEGHTVWHQPMPEVISQTVVHTPEPLLVVGDVYGNVRALRMPTGDVRWQLAAGAGPITGLSPVHDGVAFLAGKRGLVYVSAKDGRPRSVQPLGGQPGGGLAVAGNLLAHVGRGGGLFLWQANSAGAPAAGAGTPQ